MQQENGERFDAMKALEEIRKSIKELEVLRNKFYTQLAQEKKEMNEKINEIFDAANGKKDTGKMLPAPFDKYSVTKDGDVYSHVFGEARLLTPVRNTTPYLNVNLHINNKKKYVPIHHLVALAYHGPRPKDKPLIRHLDSNPVNNHVSNLKYGTPKENAQDAIEFGTIKCGADHPDALFTVEEVKQMRWMFDRGFTVAEIASKWPEAKYGVIWSAVKGKSYKNI